MFCCTTFQFVLANKFHNMSLKKMLCFGATQTSANVPVAAVSNYPLCQLKCPFILQRLIYVLSRASM